jgi:hypothetical protein
MIAFSENGFLIVRYFSDTVCAQTVPWKMFSHENKMRNAISNSAISIPFLVYSRLLQSSL